VNRVISRNCGEKSDSDPRKTRFAKVRICNLVKLLEAKGLRNAKEENMAKTSKR
jgi:hypothetical protein